MKCLLLLVLTLASAEPAAHYNPYQDVAAREEPAVQNTTLYPPRPTTGAPQSQLRALCASPRGRFPHPLDCRKYLDCWDGRVLEVQCPNDLAYSDLSGGFCDYLEYVDCGSRPVKPLPMAPTVPQIATSTPMIPTTSAPPKPPKDFSYISGKFYIFSQIRTDWNSAQSLCRLQGVGSDLVSIKSEFEHNLISAKIAELELASPAPSVYKRGNYYIGLNDQQSEGQWVWSNTNKSATYTKWMANEPGGSRAENCVATALDQPTLGWFDVGCSQQLRFICEWDPTIIGGVVSPPEIDNLVPPGFMKFGNGGHYLISTVTAPSFDDARNFCLNQGFGSDLVSLETESEFSLMKATLSSVGVGSYYIGLNDITTEGDWHWINGNKPATFIDPNMIYATKDAADVLFMDCMIMNQNHGFTYENVLCEREFHFICEWTPTAYTFRHHIESPTHRQLTFGGAPTAHDTDFSEGHEMMAPQQIVSRRKLKRRQ